MTSIGQAGAMIGRHLHFPDMDGFASFTFVDVAGTPPGIGLKTPSTIDNIHRGCGTTPADTPFEVQKDPVNDDVIRSIRGSYDRLADEYTSRIFRELQYKPFDRELLDRFATQVRGHGEVCDMGCGPGHVARYLRNAGTAVFGLDLSPKMLEEARKLSPDIQFREGNMMDLDLPDQRLAGITAFYAIVNIPNGSLLSLFKEMERVLQPEGLLLLAFHIGDEVLREEELWGRTISMDFFLFPPAEIRQYLVSAGFTVEEVIEREPYAPEVEYQSRRAYIFARKRNSN